jgi:hypothetical protein
MSAALAPSSLNHGYGGCALQLSEHAHAPSPCLRTTLKHTLAEPCKRRWRWRSALGCRAEGAVVLGHGKQVFRGTGGIQVCKKASLDGSGRRLENAGLRF